MSTPFRSGYVAVFGRPNVGKSTLVNGAIGQKVSIVSEKPQTTRDRILCVYEDSGCQIAFLDTPGMHKPRDIMNEYMVAQARQALEDANVSLLLVEAPAAFGPGDNYLVHLLKDMKAAVILVVNKIDLLTQSQVSKFHLQIPDKDFWIGVHYVSALNRQGLPKLLEAIKAKIPEGPRFFPEGDLTDRNTRFLAGELIRESVFRLTREEVPHSTAVMIDDFKEREDGKWYIAGSIYVETESQKGIVVGKGGLMIKQIGTEARAEIENLLGLPIYLELRAKVRKKWRKNPNDLKEFGYRA